MAGRDDLYPAACGKSVRDSRKSHSGAITTARTYTDCVVLYPTSGRAGSLIIVTCFSASLGSGPQFARQRGASRNISDYPTSRELVHRLYALGPFSPVERGTERRVRA